MSAEMADKCKQIDENNVVHKCSGPIKQIEPEGEGADLTGDKNGISANRQRCRTTGQMVEFYLQDVLRMGIDAINSADCPVDPFSGQLDSGQLDVGRLIRHPSAGATHSL